MPSAPGCQDSEGWPRAAKLPAGGARTMVAAIDRFADAEVFLRREGEGAEDYFQRVVRQQGELVTAGRPDQAREPDGAGVAAVREGDGFAKR